MNQLNLTAHISSHNCQVMKIHIFIGIDGYMNNQHQTDSEIKF